MAAKDKPKCLGCYYFGWAGLQRACFTPADPRILEGAPRQCGSYEDEEKKYGENDIKKYPKRLTVAEFRERKSHT